MSLNAKDYVKKYEPAPAGLAVARCFQVIDLGWQQTHFGAYYKVALGWELLDKLTKDSKPFIVNREYRHSYHEKAKLFIHLCQWHGRELSKEELETFHLSAVIGKTCWLDIIQKTNKSTGKIRAEVDTVLPLPASIPCPPSVNQPLVFSLEDATEAEYQALSDYFQKKIIWPPTIKESAEQISHNTAVSTAISTTANTYMTTQSFYAASALPESVKIIEITNHPPIQPIPTFNPAIEDVSEKNEFDEDVPQ